MHKINVLAFGNKNFNTSLEELKEHLSFRLTIANNQFSHINFKDYDVLIFTEENLKINSLNKIIKDFKKIKILVTNFVKKKPDNL